MSNNTTAVEVLNDLILINNDRINGYETAIKEVREKDESLDNLFEQLAMQSRHYKSALTQEVTVLGGTPETSDTTNSGKIYRVWMNIKDAFTSDDTQSALDSCEYGEDAAQKAYQEAIETENVPAYILELITKQKMELKASHDLIKEKRDLHAAVN